MNFQTGMSTQQAANLNFKRNIFSGGFIWFIFEFTDSSFSSCTTNKVRSFLFLVKIHDDISFESIGFQAGGASEAGFVIQCKETFNSSILQIFILEHSQGSSNANTIIST